MDLGKRYTLVRELLPTNISADLLLYTPQEFEKALSKSIVLQDASEHWMKLL